MKFFHTEEVFAHCDIPCGVYTTHQAGIAAETVEKMVEKLEQVDKDDIHSQIRFTQIKEESPLIDSSNRKVANENYLSFGRIILRRST